MSSNNLSIEDYCSLDFASDVLSNKETQTSATFITDSFDLVKGPSRPLPKGIDKSDVEPTPTNILLDCRVLKKPSDSKSLELETESCIQDIVNSISSVDIDDISEAPNSLNYCKDVAEPYLKTHLNDCEDQLESLENFIQDALEDFPDYQPCFELNGEKNDIQEKDNDFSKNKMDTIPNTINNENEKTQKISSTSKKVAEKTDNEATPQSIPTNINILKPDSPTDETQLPEDDNNDLNKNKELKRSISMESMKKSLNDGVTGVKRSFSSCLNKVETIIGIKKPENPDEKPTYYVIEKPKADVKPSHNVQTDIGDSLNSLKKMLNIPGEKINIFTDACKDFAENLVSNPNEKICAMKQTCKDFAENLINNPNEKISAMKETCKDFAENLVNNPHEKISAVKETCKDFADQLLSNPDEKMHTIKETCKDYADKLYNSSKDAITSLTSESAKFFTKSNTDLGSDDTSNQSLSKKNKMIENISADSVTSFLFKKAENKPVNDDSSKDKSVTGSSRITDAIPPAVKLGFNKLKDDIVTSKLEKSSPYDKIIPQETVSTKTPDHPETRMPTVSAIDHTPDPPPASNVFEMIRSKIFSIFRDVPERTPEPAIQEQNDDEEEDPFERFMEQ